MTKEKVIGTYCARKECGGGRLTIVSNEEGSTSKGDRSEAMGEPKYWL